jgi:hypothetical protein
MGYPLLTSKVRSGDLVGIYSEPSRSRAGGVTTGVFLKWVLPDWYQHAINQSDVLPKDWDSTDAVQDCAESLQTEIEAMQEQDLDLMALVLVDGKRARFLQEQLVYPWPGADERTD